MAVLITENIPDSGFDIVLRKIGAILLEEITNQQRIKCLHNDLGVFLERQEPFSKEEDVMINVSLNNIDIGSHNERDTQDDTNYFIDVYVDGEASMGETGSDNVRVKLHQYVGMIKYILSSTKYQLLGFDYGFIMGCYVNGIQFDDNYGSQDGSFYRMARINFRVRISEAYEMWEGVEFLGNDTVIRLDNTDKGFKLIFNT